MTHVQVSFPDSTLEMIEELQGAMELNEGYKPTRSQLLRMAVATLRKRMYDEGLIRPSAKRRQRKATVEVES